MMGRERVYDKKYAQIIVDNIITKEEITPYWKGALKGESVPWGVITRNIRRKYNSAYAERNVLHAKVSLFKYFAEKFDKDWKEYIDCNIQLIEKYGTDTTSGFLDVSIINNFCWSAILFHANNKKQVQTGIKWMEGVVRRGPLEDARWDTYANLLFKGGKTEEALLCEEKALKIAEEKKDERNSKTYFQTIAKMKRGEPTWVKGE
jgi:hypothetical protein